MAPPLSTSSSSLLLLPPTPNPIQFHYHSKTSSLLLLLHRPLPRSILKTSPSCSYSSSPNPPTFFPYSSPRRFPVPRPQQPRPSPPPEDANSGINDDDEPGAGEELVIGDCLVFDEGAFEDGVPFFDQLPSLPPEPDAPRGRGRKGRSPAAVVRAESLVPEKWREVVQEINLSKKEKRRIAHELRFGSRMERRVKSPIPDIEVYREYRRTKLAQLKPVVLDEPRVFPRDKGKVDDEKRKVDDLMEDGGRVAPKNPRLLSSGPGTLEDLADFFSSRDYVPRQVDEDKKPQGRRKLFSNEEKFLLNKRIPNLAEATSNKWLPLHSLASSGEFYLVDSLLKHNVEINAVDKDGLTALHKAILCKKQAIINYLLRNSANPFIRDKDGATLLHYAVQTASSETIKILLLYNVDINLADDDGWTPLHLAIQTKRTDIVRLLLIKGADRTLKNQDGLTPLDICLYSGHDARTYELIKLLKQTPLLKSSP